MEKELFEKLGEEISGNPISSMFGKPAFKIGKKPFIMFYENELVCKLFDEAHSEATSLSGTSLFNPRGTGKPMNNWVQIPHEHSKVWEKFAKKAHEFVKAEID